jgi:hypothetical protein
MNGGYCTSIDYWLQHLIISRFPIILWLYWNGIYSSIDYWMQYLISFQLLSLKDIDTCRGFVVIEFNISETDVLRRKSMKVWLGECVKLRIGDHSLENLNFQQQKGAQADYIYLSKDPLAGSILNYFSLYEYDTIFNVFFKCLTFVFVLPITY